MAVIGHKMITGLNSSVLIDQEAWQT